MTDDVSSGPTMSVVGAGTPTRGVTAGWEAVRDGSIGFAIGGAVTSGFGVELVKSLATADPAGRWWLVLAVTAGLATLATGFWLRHRNQNPRQAGIVVIAADPRHGPQSARRSEQAAQTYSRNTFTLTLKTAACLSGDSNHNVAIMDRLTELTTATIAAIERLAPTATQINLVPTMRLHNGFYFGARLGQTHTRKIVLHAPGRGDGQYFPATLLKPTQATATPLTVGELEQIPGGDPTRAALAIDLRHLGPTFLAPVRAACQEHNIGYLLPLTSPTQHLTPTMKTYTGVVEQTNQAWRDAPLPQAARNGHHTFFLAGPVSIAIALGARLAGTNPNQWTAFTLELGAPTTRYETFPTAPTHRP